MEKKKRYIKPVAVKELEDKIFVEKLEKFKLIPPNLLVKQLYRDDSANGLTKCICDFIRLRGGQAERINCMGRCIDNRTTYEDAVGITRTMGSIEWIKGTSTNGTADISATIRGRSVKIEVKIGADKQRQVQKDYQKSIEAAGGIYVIAKDFATFIEWYTKTFVL